MLLKFEACGSEAGMVLALLAFEAVKYKERHVRISV